MIVRPSQFAATYSIRGQKIFRKLATSVTECGPLGSPASRAVSLNNLPRTHYCQGPLTNIHNKVLFVMFKGVSGDIKLKINSVTTAIVTEKNYDFNAPEMYR
jgi:hypothetical protein